MTRETIDGQLANLPDYLPIPKSPSWDRAREYARRIRTGVEDVVKLGFELAALREQWFAQGEGGGGDQKGRTYTPAREKSLRDRVSRSDEKGWQKKVEAELNISYRTALRLIERAQIIVQLRKLIDGHPVVYTPHGGTDPVTIKPAKENVERASAALKEVMAGTISATRAWAGFAGEGQRRENQGGSIYRAPIDHAKNIEAAMKKLKTSLPHWKRLTSEARKALEDLWGEVKALIPETWQ